MSDIRTTGERLAGMGAALLAAEARLGEVRERLADCEPGKLSELAAEHARCAAEAAALREACAVLEGRIRAARLAEVQARVDAAEAALRERQREAREARAANDAATVALRKLRAGGGGDVVALEGAAAEALARGTLAAQALARAQAAAEKARGELEALRRELAA